jgi:hypothetical protein
MGTNWANFGNELIIAFFSLAVFGIAYNYAIEKFPWLASRRSAEQVVGGVFVTLIAGGFVIGWEDTIAMGILFAASGLPMLIGSWARAVRDDEEAKKINKETMQK